jgi:hypothetical protein
MVAVCFEFGLWNYEMFTNLEVVDRDKKQVCKTTMTLFIRKLTYICV